jgi:hypothetical protein
VISRVLVVVPAADEKRRIAACLRAVQEATLRLNLDRPAVSVRVVVVLDACTDDTAAVVATFTEVTVVLSTARCVGAARALGTAAGLANGPPLAEVWTAHTDADSTVPPHWLQHMVDSAERGVDVVLGTVTPDFELDPGARREWHQRHPPHDEHPNVHGANLGISASCLQTLGGWSELPSGEDVLLAERALKAGAVIERTSAIPVRTSARENGRAPRGFSSYLRTLTAVSHQRRPAALDQLRRAAAKD